MKKRLFLVNYKFTTAGRGYNEYKLVSIKYDGAMDQEWGLRLAEAQVAALFEGSESELKSVVASYALEKTYTQPKKTSGIKPVEERFGSYSSDVKPPVYFYGEGEEGNISDPVLIDIDGKRETFVVGKYFFPFKDQPGGWDVGDFYQSSLDLKRMRWSYLDLAKYKK